MKFEVLTSEVEPIIFKHPNDKYSWKWWNWQLTYNEFEFKDGRYHHKDLPNITINPTGGAVSICYWYQDGTKTGVQLFACSMRQSAKAIKYIINEIDEDIIIRGKR